MFQGYLDEEEMKTMPTVPNSNDPYLYVDLWTDRLMKFDMHALAGMRLNIQIMMVERGRPRPLLQVFIRLKITRRLHPYRRLLTGLARCSMIQSGSIASIPVPRGLSDHNVKAVSMGGIPGMDRSRGIPPPPNVLV